MLGHSVGEYVAACLAGVFSLEDALGLVAERGRLMQQMPTGAMLAVTLAEHEVAALLDGALGLAAVNGPSQCVVSGPVGSVEELQGDLSARGVETQRLRTSHAFHSVLMEPVLSAFAERVGAVERHPPRIPYVSNLTGTWVTDEEAVDPGYWARHLRETVRFGAGLGEVLRESRRVLLEVGPGQTLCGLARQQTEWGPERVAVASARYARQSTSDEEVLLQAAGRLWLAGVDVDWTALHAGERRRRVPLPTYPFERKRYWIDASAQPLASNIPDALHITTKKPDIADWFYRPTWRSSVRPREEERRLAEDGSCWLLFADECGLGARLAQRLEQKGRRVVQVAPGPGFARREESAFVIRPEGAADYEAVLRELRAEGAVPDRIVHLWSVTRRAPAPSLERSQDLGFYSLMFLAQALGSQHAGREVSLTVVTSGMQEVSGEGLAHPEKATVLGLCRVIPQEYPKVSCRSVDVVTPETGSWRDEEIEALLADCGEGRAEPVVAYRRGERWVQDFQAARLQRGEGTVRLREGGVYLITGGLGGIGLELARYLAEAVRARLVLVSRTGLPPREEWDSWLGSHGEADGTSRKIRKVQALEGRGAEVLVLSADASDRQQMGEALARAEARFGEMHGVIHSAGVAPGGVIQLKSREMAERVLAPKVGGTLVLEELLAERQPDFVVLCSSLASVLGVPGQADYCAANAFQDAFARRCAGSGGPFVLSLNWDTWGETGMAVESEVPAGLREHLQARLPTGEGILSAEGTEAFARALAQALPQLVVSTVELAPRIAHFRSLGSEETLVGEAPGEPASRHPRPELTTAYAAPRDEVEQTIAEVWQELLGFERVGVNDNFFDLGGHSLLLIQVHRRLKALFPERELSVVELFTHSTIAALAAHLSAAPGQSVAVRADEVEADARMREAGRERLARRRGVRTGLSRAEGADA
jgi:acyl transferase domain-containing protein